MIKLRFKLFSLGIYLIAFDLLYIHVLISTCLNLNEVICYVQVFRVIGIYVTSASKVLDLGLSEFFLCSQTHVLSLEFV